MLRPGLHAVTPALQWCSGRRRALGLLLLLVLGYGCAAQEAPHPTGVKGPGEANGPGTFLYHTVSVFYGTDRNRLEPSDPAQYGSGRGGVELGVCQVSIPFRHKLGQLESPFFKFFENPARHVVLLAVIPMGTGFWVAHVRDRIQASANHEAFIFIHGFNVTFADACRRTGQLAYDLKFSGAPIMWSWPSDGRVLNYVKDETDVEWSTENLRAFLQMITRETKAQTVHLIAHSMGNRALLRALAALAAQPGPPGRPLFNQVVLTAPDIDRDVFLQLAKVIRRAAERTTLYASSTDKAIEASRRIHGAPRAGEAGPHLVVTEGIDTIDVSAVDTSFLGHSYYGDKVSVISDLFDLLFGKKPPEERFHLQEQTSPGGLIYWEFRR